MIKTKTTVAVLAATAIGVVAAGWPTIGSAGTSAHRPGVAPLAGSWHVALTVKNPNFPSFTAVTAVSSTSAWAFESTDGRPAKPVAYQLTGSTWARRAFPGKTGEQVVAAASSASDNVWAFTDKHRALRYNGHSWTASHTFTKAIGSGLAISRTDVWVFGEPFVPGSGLGSWHYNGSRWSRSPTGAGLLGASPLSARSIWAFGTKKVAHWNGKAWTDASVASVLPPNNELCSSRLTGIWAQSPTSVWATGTGGCQDQGGPFVLLHYNGATWSQVSLINSLGAPMAIVPDGQGGAWIPVLTGVPGDGSMEHLTSGTLAPVKLPIGPLHLALLAAATGKHTTAALAVGYTRKSFSASTVTAVILRFGV